MTAIIIPFCKPTQTPESTDLLPYVTSIDNSYCTFMGTREQLLTIIADNQFPIKPKRIYYDDDVWVAAHRNGIYRATFTGLHNTECPRKLQIRKLAECIMAGNTSISLVSRKMVDLWNFRIYSVMRGNWSDKYTEEKRKTLSAAYDKFSVAALELIIYHPLKSEQLRKS